MEYPGKLPRLPVSPKLCLHVVANSRLRVLNNINHGCLGINGNISRMTKYSGDILSENIRGLDGVLGKVSQVNITTQTKITCSCKQSIARTEQLY